MQTLPCRMSSAAHARAAVVDLARSAGMAADRIDDLAIAVSEAFTNALEAHERCGHRHALRLECRIQPRQLEIVVEDRGGGFRPEAIPPRPPQDDPGHLHLERGWGIQLMQAVCDLVVFEPTERGTRVRLAVSYGADSAGSTAR